jgi:hypothetical protein
MVSTVSIESYCRFYRFDSFCFHFTSASRSEKSLPFTQSMQFSAYNSIVSSGGAPQPWSYVSLHLWLIYIIYYNIIQSSGLQSTHRATTNDYVASERIRHGNRRYSGVLMYLNTFIIILWRVFTFFFSSDFYAVVVFRHNALTVSFAGIESSTYKHSFIETTCTYVVIILW